jgi:RES domain-containing protein
MRRLWRMCAKAHAAKAFSGEGACLYGGRWNPPGVPLVYTSATLSLAAMELYVNVEPEEVPGAFIAIEALVPDGASIETIEAKSLPRGWRRCPAPAALQAIGQRWLEQGDTLLLSVPSVVIPEERNVLVNPNHPEFSRLAIQPPKPFSFDPRTWTRRRN